MHTVVTRNDQRQAGTRAGAGAACLLPNGWLVLWTGLLWRLLVALMVTPVMGQATATATSSSTFFSALTDPRVSLIQIPPDNFALIPEQWAAFNRTHPYVLQRDLTIRTSEPPELGQMDFVFLMRKVLLAPNVTLTLEQVVLRNVNKLGGFGLDFFMGDRDSVIVVSNSVRVKLVCPPPEQSLQAASAFSAPVGFPPNEVLMVDGVCVLQNRSNKQTEQPRQCFEDAIQFKEYTLQVRTVDLEAGTSQPGYRLVMHNTTRVCLHYVTAECIQRQSEDTCTAQLLSELLAPKQPVDSSWQPQTVAGIVVGGVVGFLAVCCLVGVLMYKHRRWWRNGNGNYKNGSEKGSEDDGPADPLVDAENTRQLQRQLLPPGPGGRKPDPAQAVKLGALLGSGSFGRVFKGRWHGMDVAVKIIDPCNPDTLPRVLKEAEVMMTLDHRNVVKAYQCSVWSKKQQEQMVRAAEQRKVSVVSSPRKGGRHSSGTGSHPSSSTTASQAASSSSTAGDMLAQQAGPSRAAEPDSVVINIVPEFITRSRPNAAAAAGAGGGPLSINTGTSSSSNAACTFSSSSAAGTAPALHSSGEAEGSSAIAARRMFAKLWKQQVPESMMQGPPTASSSREHPLRTAVTPLSSAAYTLSGSNSSSSMGVAHGGRGRHTAAGVVSSTPHQPAWWTLTRAQSLEGNRTASSSSGTGAGTSGALSSHTVSSGGEGSSSGAAAAAGVGEIQPVPARPGGMGWLRRSARRSQDVPDAQLASDSGSSQHASPTAAGAESSQSGSQPGKEKERDEMQVWLVLELCTGGSLKDAVTCGRIRSNTVQDMAKLLSRLLDAANGLAYLHKQGVVHGDLKAANVLLQHAGHGGASYTTVAKVCDFGVSTRLLDGATHRSTTSLGTITHMAPEVLRSGRVSKAADVYAFGIMMWEVFTNQTAHAGCHSGAVVELVVLRGERPPVTAGMPPQYALLMQRCWDEDAATRPTFEQVVACLELLLDNLTSSESEGRISEGVEEERTSSSSNSATGAAGEQDRRSDVQVEDLVATKVTSERLPSTSIPTPQTGTARTPSASSSGARGLLRFLSKGSSAGGVVEGQHSSGKGLAESVEGSSDWLSGPGTPGFNLNVVQLRGLRQWYMANSATLQASGSDAQVDPESQLEAQGDEAAALQHTPVSSYTATQRLQPWLDQCVDALRPSAQGGKGQAGVNSRRWWAVATKKLGVTASRADSASGSSLSQQPLTPRQSGGRLLA